MRCARAFCAQRTSKIMNQLLPIIRRKRRTLVLADGHHAEPMPVVPAPIQAEAASELLEPTATEKTEPQTIKPSEDVPEN